MYCVGSRSCADFTKALHRFQYSQVYCVGSRSCVDFFFPASQQAEFAALFRADVRGRCADSAGEGPQGRAHPDYCGGGGNVSCFRAQWSTGVQVCDWVVQVGVGVGVVGWGKCDGAPRD